MLALVGANGSGKTTLLSVLCGLRRPTSGRLEDERGTVDFHTPADALRRGITLVPQEPQLAVTMSCWENVLLGEKARAGLGRLDLAARRRARRLVREALPHVNAAAPAGTLRKADRAVLALLAALTRRPRLLALDEPTAVLGEQAVEVVSSAVEQVRADGGAVVLVSHRLRDIVALATRVVVLVDGKLTYEAADAADLTVDALVERLTHGRASAAAAPGPAAEEPDRARAQTPLLRATAVGGRDGTRLDSLELRAGEIVGLAGLAGSGRSRLLRLLAGATKLDHGTIELDGVPLHRGVRAAQRAGVAYVAEDRAADGIFAPLSVARNLSAAQLVAARPLATVSSRGAERRLARTLVDRFAIKTPHLYAPVTALSGGNQQRVMLARALSLGPKLLLADEPTQGVDLQGRQEIQAMLRQFVARGGAIVMASSDFDELLTLSTRILVLRDGAALGELRPDEASYRTLVALTSGAQTHIHDAVGEVA